MITQSSSAHASDFRSKTLDVSRMERISVHRCNCECCHSFYSLICNDDFSFFSNASKGKITSTDNRIFFHRPPFFFWGILYSLFKIFNSNIRTENLDKFPRLIMNNRLPESSFIHADDWSSTRHTLNRWHPKILIDRDINCCCSSLIRLIRSASLGDSYCFYIFTITNFCKYIILHGIIFSCMRGSGADRASEEKHLQSNQLVLVERDEQRRRSISWSLTERSFIASCAPLRSIGKYPWGVKQSSY